MNSTLIMQQTPREGLDLTKDECRTPPLCGNTKDHEQLILQSKNEIIKQLLASLEEQSDLVVDFTSLKTCLNPMGIGNDNKSLAKEIDYEDFLYDILDKQDEKLPKLKKLIIRRLLKYEPLTDDQHDYYSQLTHNIMQLSCLTELDFMRIPEDGLQLWGLHNLRKLSITDSKLESIPGSVGRLKQLEELDLSRNKLKHLPVTLTFCSKLVTLDLHRNEFTSLPGTILSLKNLKTLRRLDNPLYSRGDFNKPHLSRKRFLNCTKSSDKKTYSPLSLQSSCTKVIFTSELDYWEDKTIGQLQCKILDTVLAVQFINCDHCNRMISLQKANLEVVQVMLVTFCELSNVPFTLYACNSACQDKILEKYSKRNIVLQEELDALYEEQTKKAQEEMRHGGEDTRTNPTPRQHGARGSHSVNRRRKRCSIM